MSLKKKTRVKVLLLESGTGGGGSVNFLRDFLLHIDLKQMEPFVGCYFPNSSIVLNELRGRGIPVVFFRNSPPPPLNVKARGLTKHVKLLGLISKLARIAFRTLTIQIPQAVKIAAFIKRNGIEVLMLNQDVHYHVPGLLAAKLLAVPCVCRKAGGIGEGKRIKRIVTPWVDVFASISEATHEDQRNTPGTKKLIKIYRGVDLKRFACLLPAEELRLELGLPPGKGVVATISRIEEGKGHREFLRMAAAIRKRESEVVFLIVGDQGLADGTLVAELKAMARELGIADAVVFAGWREDIPSILSVVDIFVHCPTSFIEGLCTANLEAMANGKPTVVSNNGGLPDAVLDGVTGYVVPPGDVAAMTSAVMRLLGDVELCREFGRCGQRRVRQFFDIARTARQLENVLLDCAAARSQQHATDSAQAEAA